MDDRPTKSVYSEGNDDNDSGNSSNILGRPRKRARVSQACVPCHLRKGKCDGRQPICGVCKSLKVDCSYDPNPKRRGLRPGQYTSLERRALLAELIAAYLIEKTPGAEESVHSFFSCPDSNLSSLSARRKQAELGDLLSRWRRLPMSRWLHDTTSQTDPALDNLSKIQPWHGPRSAPSNSLEDTHPLDRHPGNHATTLDCPGTSKPLPSSGAQDWLAQGSSKWNADAEMHPSGLPPDDCHLTPLPSNIEHIFDVYFAYTHTWLPFIDKFKVCAMVGNISSTPQVESGFSSSLQSANLALIWAMIAYTLPRMQESGRICFTAERKITPMQAAKLSLSMLPACDTDMEQEHAQALIILSLFHFEYGSERVSWVLIGLAGRVTVDLSCIKPGQHVSSSSRRTALACFVVEGIIAATLDRSPQVLTHRNHNFQQTADFVELTGIEVDAEGWEEWSSWEIPGCESSNNCSGQPRRDSFRVLSMFNKMVHLVEMFNLTTSRFRLLRGTTQQYMTQSATARDASELSAWMHHIREAYPTLHPENLKNDGSPHAINFQCIYWTFYNLSCSEKTSGNQYTQLDTQNFGQLALAINDLMIKYSSLYPLNTAPLGLKASIMIVLPFLSEADPLREVLIQGLSIMKKSGDTPTRPNGTYPFFLKVNDSESSEADVPFKEQNLKKRKTNDSGEAQLPSSPHNPPRWAVESASQIKTSTESVFDYHIPPQQTRSTVLNMSEDLDADIMGTDLGDSSSLSTHDLIELDSAVWNVYPVLV